MRNKVEVRLQRALAMLTWLVGRDPVPIEDLCERFGVTRHQLRKDLLAIETMSPGDDTFARPELEIDDEADTVELHFLPGAFKVRGNLTRDESFAALAVGRAALELLEDSDAVALASALGKLDAALSLGRELAIDIDEPGHLDAVRDAAAEHRTLEVDYWSAWRDELSTRRVDPIWAFYAMGEWYLTCHDHHRGALLRFRVDRIIGCRDTGDRFEPYDLDPDHEIFTAPDVQATEVEVRFPASASWVPEYVDGEVSDQTDEGFTMRLISVGESWLARLLLRSGGDVVAPPELVGLRSGTARRVLARYEPTGSAGATGAEDVSPGRVLGTRFDEALVHASDLHGDDVRKGSGVPYVAHLLATCSLVLELGGGEDEAIAALLHDAAEDHGGEVRLADLAGRFGPVVADLVRALSDSLTDDPDGKAPWKDRKVAYLGHLAGEDRVEVLRVSLADKIHNARSIVADQLVGGLQVFGLFKPARVDDAGAPLADAPDLARGWRETVWYYDALHAVYAARPEGLGIGPTLLAVEVERMRTLGAEVLGAASTGSAPGSR